MRPWILCIAIWITGGPTWGQSKDQPSPPSQPSNGKNTEASVFQRGTKGAPFVIEIEHGPEGNTQAADEKTGASEKDVWDKIVSVGTAAAALFTLGLLIVGGCGVKAALSTLAEIQRQTKATEANIKALMDSERAWVLISDIHSVAVEPWKPGDIDPHNRFHFVLKNKGKTVARLIGLEAEPHLLQGGGALPVAYKLPAKPVYQESLGSLYQLGFRHGAVLAPEDTIEVWVSLDTILRNPQDIQEITSLTKILVVCGRLKYMDFPDQERTLQFCYRYIPPGVSFSKFDADKLKARWIFDGSPEYNTHT